MQFRPHPKRHADRMPREVIVVLKGETHDVENRYEEKYVGQHRRDDG